MRVEIGGHRGGVFNVTDHAQRQRLEPLQEEKGVERTHRRAEIAQRLGPQLHQIAVGAERLVELQTVIRRRGIGDHRKAPVRPVERSRLHDHPADARAMAADEFGRGVDDDVGAPFDRAAEIGRGEGVVDDQRKPMIVGQGRQRRDIQDVSAGIADGLPVKGLGVLADRRLPGIRIVGIDPGQADGHLAQHVLELVHGPAVERG